MHWPSPLALCRGSDALSLVAELVFFDLPVQRRQPDIEQAGCFRLISPGVVEDTLYMQFLYARQVECRQWPRRPGAGNLQVRRQVFEGELRAVGEDDGSFDDILQFPDIALPFVLLKTVEKLFAHTFDTFVPFPRKYPQVEFRQLW